MAATDQLERPTLIVHHGGCWDGFGAAMVIADHLALQGCEQFELLPASYGMPAPDCTGRTVFVVDFSFAPDVMQAMAEQADRLIWLDHHKTAIDAVEDVEAFCEAVLSLDDSGVRLAWNWTHPNGERAPWLVDYIEDRDLWRKALPDSDAVQMWIRSHDMNPVEWRYMLTTRLAYAKADGAAMLVYHHRLVENAARQAVPVELGGVRMPLVSCSYDLGSDVCDHLINAAGVPVAAYFLLNRDGRWQYGFRSRSDFDVSALAKQFGGGGHAQAAGCQSDTPLHRLLD